MTNEEINKIIAEFRGWVEYHPTPESISKGYPSYSYWTPPRDSSNCIPTSRSFCKNYW